MPKKLTKGKPATFKHSGVQYFPFGAKPGAGLVLSADPWSFLGSYLRKIIRKSKGDKRRRFERALYFADLAHSFDRAARHTELPARCTLAYYSALNLAKCYISTQGKLLGDTIESHGLSPSSESEKDISVSKRAKKSVNIFHEFVVALGSERPVSSNLSLVECISHIPELHELAFRTNSLSNDKRSFLPIEIKILTDDSESWLFSDLCYWKKNHSQINGNKILTGERASYFMPARSIDTSQIAHRCKRRKRFEWKNFERIYQNICREYRKLDVAAVLTRGGYRYYCDLDEPKYHHLAYTFLVLFHFGTVTRYDPAGTKKLIEGELRPIVSEAMALCPDQMLYQIVSYITESTCAVPFSKL